MTHCCSVELMPWTKISALPVGVVKVDKRILRKVEPKMEEISVEGESLVYISDVLGGVWAIIALEHGSPCSTKARSMEYCLGLYK